MALPVAQGQTIWREQLVLRERSDDGPMDREVSVQALGSVLGYGVTSRLAVFGMAPYFFNKELAVAMPMGGIERDTSGFGGVVTTYQTLHALDDDNREISYSIDEGRSPVSPDEISSYEGHVRVRSVTEGDGGTFVEWYSSWKGNDEAAAEFCHGIYAGLLEQLKKTLEH
ncbi:polyketide cyclase/dehydrase/lipid transport protein [Marinobacter sp. LV10R520-4]|nr:polyketide cyclase/dehydrase/lipid transport protein [Marinobacter sp. LV10R520-4]